MYNISHLCDILPSSNKTNFISERKHLWWIQMLPSPNLPTPTPSVHYTNYLQYLQSFYTTVESQCLFLEEYLPKGTHCPYGFLSATLSALDVTLLSWSVGLLEGLATAFCEYKEVWSTSIFQYVLTIIIFCLRFHELTLRLKVIGFILGDVWEVSASPSSLATPFTYRQRKREKDIDHTVVLI